jgi:hypothetical protein
MEEEDTTKPVRLREGYPEPRGKSCRRDRHGHATLAEGDKEGAQSASMVTGE